MPTTEVDWLTDLRSQANNIRELQDLFSMPGWKHLERLWGFKEQEAMRMVMGAEDMTDVKAGRALTKFVAFCKNLPEGTEAHAEELAGDIALLTEEDSDIAR